MSRGEEQRVETKAKALAALRRYGWRKSRLQLTRGATSYALPSDGNGPVGPMITVAPTTFAITGADDWNVWPNLMRINNIAAPNASRVVEVCDRLRERGHLVEGEMTELGLAVAIGRAIAEDAAG